jgi:hypothetical protein
MPGTPPKGSWVPSHPPAGAAEPGDLKQHPKLAQLSDNLRLLDSGLDSLSFTLILRQVPGHSFGRESGAKGKSQQRTEAIGGGRSDEVQARHR